MRERPIAGYLDGRTLRVIAVGKAAPFMADAFARLAGPQVRDGIVIGTHLPVVLPSQLAWIPSSHPLPDERSVAAGRSALDIARQTEDGEALVVLLSGGAGITALNTVRKHPSAVKGGRLAAAAAGSTVCLAISDVVGDDLSVIGSGPTVPDPSTYADAWRCVEQFGVKDRLSKAAVAYLQAGAEGTLEETPKPGDARLRRSVSRVIGGRQDAMDGAREAASSLGYDVILIQDPIVGDARTVGPALLEHARALSAGRCGPLCVIASGETTVKLVGNGKGGRNQEMALSVAKALAESAEWEETALGSIGTDGIDGPTGAAGAYADTTTAARAGQQALDPAAFLADNNAHAFFQSLNDLIITGPTTTNVGDVQIVLFR